MGFQGVSFSPTPAQNFEVFQGFGGISIGVGDPVTKNYVFDTVEQFNYAKDDGTVFTSSYNSNDRFLVNGVVSNDWTEGDTLTLELDSGQDNAVYNSNSATGIGEYIRYKIRVRNWEAAAPRFTVSFFGIGNTSKNVYLETVTAGNRIFEGYIKNEGTATRNAEIAWWGVDDGSGIDMDILEWRTTTTNVTQENNHAELIGYTDEELGLTSTSSQQVFNDFYNKTLLNNIGLKTIRSSISLDYSRNVTAVGTNDYYQDFYIIPNKFIHNQEFSSINSGGSPQRPPSLNIATNGKIYLYFSISLGSNYWYTNIQLKLNTHYVVRIERNSGKHYVKLRTPNMGENSWLEIEEDQETNRDTHDYGTVNSTAKLLGRNGSNTSPNATITKFKEVFNGSVAADIEFNNLEINNFNYYNNATDDYTSPSPDQATFESNAENIEYISGFGYRQKALYFQSGEGALAKSFYVDNFTMDSSNGFTFTLTFAQKTEVLEGLYYDYVSYNNQQFEVRGELGSANMQIRMTNTGSNFVDYKRLDTINTIAGRVFIDPTTGWWKTEMYNSAGLLTSTSGFSHIVTNFSTPADLVFMRRLYNTFNSTEGYLINFGLWSRVLSPKEILDVLNNGLFNNPNTTLQQGLEIYPDFQNPFDDAGTLKIPDLSTNAWDIITEDYTNIAELESYLVNADDLRWRTDTAVLEAAIQDTAEEFLLDHNGDYILEAEF
jgi:hypothetical protein